MPDRIIYHNINMPDRITLASVSGIIMAVIGFISYPNLFSPSPLPSDLSLTSPNGLICRAHQKMASIQPNTVSLFSILRLDPTQPPFVPTEACLYPYGENYEAARRAVSDAWMASYKRDGNDLVWRDVYALAAIVLLNDTTRTVYMKSVLPGMDGKKKGDGAWMKICDKYYREVEEK